MRDEILRRRPKSSRRYIQDDDNDDNNNDDNNNDNNQQVEVVEQEVPRNDGDYNDQFTTTVSKRRKIKSDIRENELYAELPEELPSDESIENNLLGFCCYNCSCSDEHKLAMILDENDQYITASESNSLWHRRCCHNMREYDPNWLSPIEQAFDKVQRLMLNPKAPPSHPTIFLYDKKMLYKAYKTATRFESEHYNEDTLPFTSEMALTNKQYMQSMKLFQKDIQMKRTLQPAVVLDMFGGIGSAIIALKLNGVRMQKIIHVDHDKVAKHVHRWNHDPMYYQKIKKETVKEESNQEIIADTNQQYTVHGTDHIEHVYEYNRFEDIRDNIDAFLQKHGPIDIIIGGPPCVDYSPVNAQRLGTDGRQGSYMVQFGHMIQEIQATQDRKVYFLAENTVIRNHKDKEMIDGDLSKIEQAFGLSHSYTFDARDVSPCRRNRTYLTNIPFEVTDQDVLGGQATVSMCLDDDYKHPAHYTVKDMLAKSNCFMAHPGRINDTRMLVCKEEKQANRLENYLCRYITTPEREKMMGFPLGYVEKPVQHLFTSILQQGFASGLQTDQYWKHALDECYHDFSGNYHKLNENDKPFTFECKPAEIGLKLASPPTTKTPSRFNMEGYAKHLIGNAFSVPVISIFLRPLTKVFGSTVYEGYDYQYEWVNKIHDV